jgi:hypothetical protein
MEEEEDSEVKEENNKVEGKDSYLGEVHKETNDSKRMTCYVGSSHLQQGVVP